MSTAFLFVFYLFCLNGRYQQFGVDSNIILDTRTGKVYAPNQDNYYKYKEFGSVK